MKPPECAAVKGSMQESGLTRAGMHHRSLIQLLTHSRPVPFEDGIWSRVTPNVRSCTEASFDSSICSSCRKSVITLAQDPVSSR
jgi:hypothetical protein